MRRHVPILTMILLLVVAVAIAGCQRDMSAREYVQRMDRAALGIDRAMQALGSTSTTTPDTERIEATATALDRAVRALRRIDPPSRAARAHQQLERSTAALAASMHTLASDVQHAATSQQRLEAVNTWSDHGAGARAITQIGDALTQLDRAGYNVTTPRHPASAQGS